MVNFFYIYINEITLGCVEWVLKTDWTFFFKNAFGLFIVGTSIDDLKNKVVNAINAESAKEHGSLTDMALGKHIEPYFNFMLFNSNILFISNKCTYWNTIN